MIAGVYRKRTIYLTLRLNTVLQSKWVRVPGLLYQRETAEVQTKISKTCETSASPSHGLMPLNHVPHCLRLRYVQSHAYSNKHKSKSVNIYLIEPHKIGNDTTK